MSTFEGHFWLVKYFLFGHISWRILLNHHSAPPKVKMVGWKILMFKEIYLQINGGILLPKKMLEPKHITRHLQRYHPKLKVEVIQVVFDC